MRTTSCTSARERPAARLASRASESRSRGMLGPQRRRFAQHHRPQELGDPEEAVLEGGEVVRVTRRDRADRLGGLARVVMEHNRAVLGQSRVGRIERHGAVAEVLELEVRDDLRLQHRDDVGGAGDAPSRPEFLGDAGAAEDRAALEDQHAYPGAREVGGGRQAVVTPADHDRVICSGGPGCRGRLPGGRHGLHRRRC